jgi:polysaccharide export outer membrane protein
MASPRRLSLGFLLLLLAFDTESKVSAQVAAQSPQATASGAVSAESIPFSADYVIGPDDVLSIMFWQDKDLSAEVVVLPDGNINLPLLNVMKAAGLTPDQLRRRVVEEARSFVEDPDATVAVKQVNSRKVFITGEVQKPGVYPLTGPTTVVQLIATAGGLTSYAKLTDILVMRTENGQPVPYRVNYKQILELKNLGQNLELKPRDTVIVP